MLQFLVLAAFICFAVFFFVGFFKREARKNREKIARLAARDQALLIDEENKIL